eukprot:2537741-Rhodomonas_salina.1
MPESTGNLHWRMYQAQSSGKLHWRMYQAQLNYYLHLCSSSSSKEVEEWGQGVTQKQVPWSLESGALQLVMMTALTAIPLLS